MKKDKALEKLIKSIDTKTAPPEGLEGRLLSMVMSQEIKPELVLTPFERFFFEKPLRTAFIIAVPVSGSLWALMGSSFVKLLSGLIG